MPGMKYAKAKKKYVKAKKNYAKAYSNFAFAYGSCNLHPKSPPAAKHLLINKIPETLDNRCTDVIPLQHTIHESQTQLSTLKNTNNETEHFDNA